MQHYTEILTKEERAKMIKLGMLFGACHETQDFTKEARGSGFFGGLWGGLGTTAKASLAVALALGIPIGAAAHWIDKRTSEMEQKERSRQSELDFYRDLTSSIESGLATEKSPYKM